MSAEPRVAVVTGASSGIGRATAELLRARGVTTVGLARRLEDGPDARRCDVTDEAQVARVLAGVAGTFGRLDILVTCAGVVSQGDPLALTAADWEATLRTNVIGTFLCCKHALAAMRPRRYGRIVTISSIAGRAYSRTASVAYTASKHAVIGLTRHLAALYGGDGITVNCVAPSQTKTTMLEETLSTEEIARLGVRVPVGRLAEPGEVAAAIAFLCSEEASYVNGAVLDVNGGLL